MNIASTMDAATVRLAFDGRLDSAWSDSAARALDEAVRSGRARIELDLAQVSFLSSVGLGVLLRAMTRFKAVGGTLAIVAASEVVRDMLRVSRLEALLVAPRQAADPRGETVPIGSGWTGELRRSAHAAAPAAARFVACGMVEATAGTLAIGHLALATDEASAAGLFGEGLVAGGAIAVAPAEAPRPDCLASGIATNLAATDLSASAGGEPASVRCVARDALVVDADHALHGALHGVFEGARDAAGLRVARPVPLSELAQSLVRAVQAPVAIVAVGECAGAFGAWARRSPDRWDRGVSAMSDADMRASLRFAGEPMHAGESMVAVGIACDGARLGALPAEVAAALAPCEIRAAAASEQGASRLLLHAHVAVAAYRPVPRSTHDVRAVGALLAEQPLRAVMHALRGRAGAESAFARGSFWAVPLAPAGDGARA